MTKAKDKAAGNPKVLQVARTKDQTEAQAVAWMAVNLTLHRHGMRGLDRPEIF